MYCSHIVRVPHMCSITPTRDVSDPAFAIALLVFPLHPQFTKWCELAQRERKLTYVHSDQRNMLIQVTTEDGFRALQHGITRACFRTVATTNNNSCALTSPSEFVLESFIAVGAQIAR